METIRTRKVNRLPYYDYSQNGYYFVTVCSFNKQHIFGEIIKCDKESVGAALCRPHMHLFEIGKIVSEEIERFSEPYEGTEVIKYVIMPNHIHMVIAINDGASGRQGAAPTLAAMVGQFKRVVSMRIGISIWQKGFYDHIIRSQTNFEKIWEYIDFNIDNWHKDEYNK